MAWRNRLNDSPISTDRISLLVGNSWWLSPHGDEKQTLQRYREINSNAMISEMGSVEEDEYRLLAHGLYGVHMPLTFIHTEQEGYWFIPTTGRIQFHGKPLNLQSYSPEIQLEDIAARIHTFAYEGFVKSLMGKDTIEGLSPREQVLWDGTRNITGALYDASILPSLNEEESEGINEFPYLAFCIDMIANLAGTLRLYELARADVQDSWGQARSMIQADQNCPSLEFNDPDTAKQFFSYRNIIDAMLMEDYFSLEERSSTLTGIRSFLSRIAGYNPVQIVESFSEYDADASDDSFNPLY